MELVAHCQNELVPAACIQTEKEILSAEAAQYQSINPSDGQDPGIPFAKHLITCFCVRQYRPDTSWRPVLLACPDPDDILDRCQPKIMPSPVFLYMQIVELFQRGVQVACV